MITDFDKSGLPLHFKKKFGECIEDGDFESAIDYLLKYRSERNNADFHLACGMLYLQMCLDSDDNELVCMAYREFLMHIRRFPDDRKAYRDILAALTLRHDYRAFFIFSKWIKDKGFDYQTIINELAECGVLWVSSDSDAPFLDDLFDGEYGEICDSDSDGDKVGAAADGNLGSDGGSRGKRRSSVIAFDGKSAHTADAEIPDLTKSDGENDEIGKFDAAVQNGKLGSAIPFDSESRYSELDENAESGDEEFGDFINAYIYGDEYDEAETELIDGLDGVVTQHVETEGGSENDVIRLAENAYESGNYDEAISVLSNIPRNDPMYYYSLNMLALIYMDKGEYANAEKKLDTAMELKPDGALGGALLCQLYEYEGKTESIPPLLKKIDVKDYVNCAHLYKSFDMVMKYCSPEDAALLLKRYIDEFNIIEMRLVYAQILYNLGERDYAIDEFYTISRIFYDDVNARLLYVTSRSGIEKLNVSTEAPQSILAVIVENIMALITGDELTDEIVNSEMFRYGFEFFLTLEFKNERRLSVKMFDTVRIASSEPKLKEKILDALVSPYVEPIVKAVILGEVIGSAPDAPFLFEVSYCPYDRSVLIEPLPDKTFGYYIAYAFTAVFDPDRIEELNKTADKAVFPKGEDTEESKAFYLLKKLYGKNLPDDRFPYALGYESRAAAMRDFKSLSAKMKNK